jgi:hypothetical protein
MSESPDTDPNRATEPDVGLIADEDLPEDLQPTDDNPLAQDPDQREEREKEKQAEEPAKVEGMPDMGEPGAG